MVFSQPDLEGETNSPLSSLTGTQPPLASLSEDCEESASLALGSEDSGVDSSHIGGAKGS